MLQNNPFQSLLFLFVFTLFVACTPKTTTKVQEVPKENTGIDESVDPTCRQFKHLGSKKQEALEAFVLYRDFLKAKDYEESYSYWKTAFKLAPGSDGRKKYHYDDGVKLFSHFYKNAAEADKKMWVDSIKMLYDRRKQCFGDDSYLAGRQAFDLYYNFKDHADLDYIWNLFKQSIDAKGEKADYFIVNPMTKLLIDKTGDKSLSLEESKKYANMLWSVIKYGTANCGDKCETWDVINSYAPDRLESLEGIEGFYDCEYYKNKYYPIYLENIDNCEVVERVKARLIRGNCPSTMAELVELDKTYNEKCKKTTVTGTLSEAKELYLNGKYRDAIKKYEEYLSTATNPDKIANVEFFISKIYYRDLKNYPMSRKFALKAAKTKPNWGDPYILIGKLYASSGPICGPGTGWDSQIVTWPAIDKWEYAKKIDPSCKKEANQLIGRYKKFMPSMEDIFSRPSVQVGKNFYVGCWIKENTKVRPAK